MNNDKNERRLGWIEACYRYAGRFAVQEKAAYRTIFDVTDSTVSRDLEKFVNRMNTHLGSRVFFKDGHFVNFDEGKLGLMDQPLFPIPAMRDWMSAFLPGTFVSVPAIERSLPTAQVLAAVIRSLSDRKPMRVEYVSRTSGCQHRDISVHTVVDIAGRMHARAFDHLNGEYRDFVLARILSVGPATRGLAYKGLGHFSDNNGDLEWHESAEVLIKGRSEAVNQGVCLDFGLDDKGERRTKIRRSLLNYVLDSHHPGYKSPVEILLSPSQIET